MKESSIPLIEPTKYNPIKFLLFPLVHTELFPKNTVVCFPLELFNLHYPNALRLFSRLFMM